MLGESKRQMRVLLLHNRYRAQGGEERAVGDLLDLLARRGHQVELLERSSDQLGRASASRALLTGGVDPDTVTTWVRKLQAEIVHAHNLHPLLGFKALEAARQAGARTVLQLHNFRLFCAIAVAYRDGGPCYDCRGTNTLPGLIHRCRGSLAESAVYAAGLRRQQPRLLAGADRFAVLSDAHGARLYELGVPAERSDTLPNFIPERLFAPRSLAHEGSFALVAGRLVEEKGFDTAIRAAAGTGVPLVVAGDGPDEARLRSIAHGSEVRFTGWIQPEQLAELRAQAGAILVPSRCEEASPYAALDGLAAGIPVLGSDLGGLPEVATLTLPAADPAAWAAALAQLWPDIERRRALGERTLEDARARFGEDRYHERLLAIYERALGAA
ncbi:MAG: glycosyltransferase family 4 protein [Solirubrobacteraceae bacterium]